MEPNSAAAIFLRSHYAGRKPDPLLTVSEWANRFRILSSTSAAEHGEWRTSRTPYLREIMDCLSPSSPVVSVVLKKGSQTGGTEAGNNWLGYIIDQAPGPTLVVLPSLAMAHRWSKQRLAHLIEDSPALRGKVAEARSRDSGNTILTKEFPGGMLVITGANSAVGLRSMPARYLFFDEVDAFPGDVEGEGDPVALAEKRSTNFKRRKSLKVSTPGVEGLSRISREFDNGDRRYYFVPCPECGHFQVLLWKNFEWEPGKPETVWLNCISCRKAGDDGLDLPVRIEEHSKTQILAAGRWIPTVERPELLDIGLSGDEISEYAEELGSRTVKIASFHLSSLYSPIGWYSWVDAATDWVNALADKDRLKVFINTVLGETWQEKGEAPDDELLYGRGEHYPLGSVCAGGLFLTAGGDVQADRIEVQIVAWGRNKESWLVDHVVLAGRPSEPAVWQELTVLLNTTYRHEFGVDMSIIRMAIDSGFATQEVYAWARMQGPGRVLVIKGQDHGSSAIGQPSAVDVTLGGVRIKRGMKVWPVATHMLKSELYGWLQTRPAEGETYPPYPPGYCHFPELDREFFRQLTAEHYVTRVVKGYRRGEWVKKRERNEALDCRIYARAAASQVGIDRADENYWLARERELNKPIVPPPPVSGSPAVVGSSQGAPVKSRVFARFRT